jgi:hypothetical protein
VVNPTRIVASGKWSAITLHFTVPKADKRSNAERTMTGRLSPYSARIVASCCDTSGVQSLVARSVGILSASAAWPADCRRTSADIGKRSEADRLRQQYDRGGK